MGGPSLKHGPAALDHGRAHVRASDGAADCMGQARLGDLEIDAVVPMNERAALLWPCTVYSLPQRFITTPRAVRRPAAARRVERESRFLPFFGGLLTSTRPFDPI
jgi:hypothetical protein